MCILRRILRIRAAMQLTCYCSTTHELLQFYRNEKIRGIPAHENNEENTDHRNSGDQYENNKKVGQT